MLEQEGAKAMLKQYRRRAVLRAAGTAGLLFGVSLLAACGSTIASATNSSATSASTSSVPVATVASARSPSASSAVASSAAASTAASTAAPTTAASVSAATVTSTAVATPASQAATSAQGTTVRLSYWAGADTLSYQKAVDAFIQTQPNSKVTLELITGPYQTKVESLIAAGSAPDVQRQNSGQFEAMASRKVFADLDPYLKLDKIDKTMWWDASVGGATFLGTMYALPSDLSDLVLFYIKPIFDQMGLPYPDATWDWDKLLSVAQAATVASTDPSKVRWGFDVTNWWPEFDCRIREAGGNFWNTQYYTDQSKCVVDSAEGIHAFGWDMDMIHKYKVSPGAADLKGLANGRFDLYQSLKVAMWMGGSWEGPQVLARWPASAPDWDLVMFPKAPGKNRAGAVWSDEHSLWVDSKKKDAGWQLLTFLSGDAGNRIMDLEVGRSIPGAKSAAQDPLFAKYHGKNMQAALDTLSWSWITSQAEPYSLEVGQVMTPLINDMYAGAKDAKTAALAIASGVNSLLAAKRGK